MNTNPASRSAFGRARGRGGRGARGGRGRGAKKEEVWVPCTKLGQLVAAGKIKTIEEIFTFSRSIKEPQIVDALVPGLKDEIVKTRNVQKQTTAGQRNRQKVSVVIGDCNGHVGVGVKVSKDMGLAIAGANRDAKLNLITVRKGYWGNKLGQPHTVPCKVSAKCGSVIVRLIPAPRGTGIVGAPITKKIISMAGIEDCYTMAKGQTSTQENFAKATLAALKKTYEYLTPDLWNVAPAITDPINERM